MPKSNLLNIKLYLSYCSLLYDYIRNFYETNTDHFVEAMTFFDNKCVVNGPRETKNKGYYGSEKSEDN